MQRKVRIAQRKACGMNQVTGVGGIPGIGPATARPTQVGRRLIRVWPDFGQALSVSRSKAFDIAASGEVRTVRLGRSLRVPIEEIDRLIEAKLAEGAA